MAEFREMLKICLVQTNCSPDYWRLDVRHRAVYAEQLWSYVRSCVAALRLMPDRIDVVLLPELSLPRARVRDLERFAKELGVIIIVGLDYLIREDTKRAVNEALVLVPDNWRTKGYGRFCQPIRVGKVSPAPKEQEALEARGLEFFADPVYSLFDGVDIGRFGVTICYDLMDLERATLYAGRIQHLFVLAYNQDTQSFFHITEALSRVMFCNVVICNTGFYGGSLAVAPFYQPWRRTIYKHEGAKLATSQVISLPVGDLIEAQKGDRKKIPPKDDQYLFKNVPPQLQGRFEGILRAYKI